MPPPPGYLTLTGLTERMALSRNTVYAAIERAKADGVSLEPIRIGNTTLYTEAQAQALQEHREGHDVREIRTQAESLSARGQTVTEFVTGSRRPMTTAFYDPSPEQIAKLSQPWSAAFSGGKDSTSLVTWIEWLRRSGQIDLPTPKLVRSDTEVEDPPLMAVAEEMTMLLKGCGWQCTLVRPALNRKLYNRILGTGNVPIHPGVRRMRWCTQATKIGPMEAWRKSTASVDDLTITGLRLGESKMRDGKILRGGCAAGGECGIPEPGEGRYSPILHWQTCQVIDWLNGHVERRVTSLMRDVLAVTKHLVDIYGVITARTLFEERQVISAARFGCIGCPAIAAERHAPDSVVRRYGKDSPLLELYDVWFEARRRVNRCYQTGKPKGGRSQMGGYGPIRMEARQRLFARVMDIQRRAGVVLVTPEDEAFIRQCWEEKRYPRGWSEADELVRPPENSPLFTANSVL